MSRDFHLRARRRRAGVLLGFILALTAVFTPAAMAHDVLVDSDPAEGAHFDQAPADVRLTFNNELLDLGTGAAGAVIQNAAGEQVAELPLTLDGRDASAALPQLADGSYKLAWSVVSSDGHRIQGVINFSVGTAAPSTNSAGPSSAAPTGTEAIAKAFPTWGTPIIAAGIIATIVLLILQLRKKKS